MVYSITRNFNDQPGIVGYDVEDHPHVRLFHHIEAKQWLAAFDDMWILGTMKTAEAAIDAAREHEHGK